MGWLVSPHSVFMYWPPNHQYPQNTAQSGNGVAVMSERSFGCPHPVRLVSLQKGDLRIQGDVKRHRKKRAVSKPRRGACTILPAAQKRTNPADQGFWLPSLQRPVRQQIAVIGACQSVVGYYSSPTSPAEECCTLMCRNIPELLSRCIFWRSTSGVGPGTQRGWHASRGSQCSWSSDHSLSRKGLAGNYTKWQSCKHVRKNVLIGDW